MRCCAPGCKNDSRYRSKSQGITFHIFPNNPDLRSLWLQALGKKESWEPSHRSTICSEHFRCQDLYKTKSGLQKVRTGAVPLKGHVISDSSNCKYGEPAATKVCRICLVMDCKLFPIRKYKLEQAYEHLTGVSPGAEARLPQKLCAECMQRLINFNRFRLKSLRANSLMTELLKKHDHLTIQNLQCINRKNNQLASNLNTKLYIDHYDLLYIDGDLPVDPTSEEFKTENDLKESDTDVENEENSNLYIDVDLPVDPTQEEFKTENDLMDSETYVENEENSSNLYITGDLSVTSTPEEFKTENDLIESDTDVEKEENSNLYIDGYLSVDPTSEEFKTENDLIESDTDVENEENSNLYITGDLSVNSTPEEFETENDLKESDTDVENEENPNEKILIIELDDDYVQNDDSSTDDSLPLELVKSKKAKITTKRKKAVKKDPAVPKIDGRRKPFSNDDLNENLFTITKMTIEEQILDIKKRQESSNYKNSVFKCTQCYKGFRDEDAYNSHTLRHTDACGDYFCPICKVYYKTSHALCTHITAQHNERFNCNKCSYTSTNRQAARLHESWHKGTKYKCPHCFDEFLKYSTYMGHVRIKHPSDFVCQLCGYSFVSERGIVLHKNLKHRLENSTIPEDAPTCDLCNIRFMNTDALKRHVKVSARHKPKDKDSREQDKPQRRRVDRRETSNERKGDGGDRADGRIPCEQCGVKLKNWRKYDGHFRRMHAEMNRTNFPSITTTCMCEVCGKILQSYTLLKDHRWVHTGELPFKCDVCGKSFRMKQRLVAHRRKHSAQKTTYMCLICGKEFSSHANRQRHMYIHTGFKPFKCEICGKCFMHRCQRREHINYVHLKKPWPKRSRGKRPQDGRPVPA